MQNYIKIYYDLIKKKKINVSEKVLKQVKLLIKDIENPNKYVFDIKRATRPIEFIEKFCRHSKGKWAGKPVILDLWQKVIIQALFGFIDNRGNRKYREILIIVARKNGKSTLASAIALYMLFSDGEAVQKYVALLQKGSAK